MLRRILIAVAVVVIAGAAFIGLSDGYGADSHETPLPISGVHPVGFSANLQLEVECADHVRVEVRPDPAGSGLPQVTVWGRPRIGRCTPTDATINTLQLARDAQQRGEPVPTKIVDGATSQVVSLTDQS
ncbi:hypothetical protein [Aquihabitans sp. McL0605]|uniref:hypothetical protein n=1 Tax=Aquihabitans sp. McL0605 TaxID=3415671 RepID=UPI003CEC455F